MYAKLIKLKMDKTMVENQFKKYILGNGNPLQESCLENSMDRAAWRAIVRGVANNRTRLSD